MGGWNPDANPWELPSNQATQLDNFLIRPGNIMARGAFSAIADISSIMTAPVGVLAAGALCVSGLATVGIMPWDAPLLAANAAQLAVASTSLIWVSALGIKVTSVAGSRHLVPGPRWINFDGILYGLGFDSEATALQDGGASYYMPPTQLLTQGFVAGALTGSSSPDFTTATLVSNGSGAAWSGSGSALAAGPVAATGTTQMASLIDISASLPSTAVITGYSAEVNGIVSVKSNNTLTIEMQLIYNGSIVGVQRGGSYAPFLPTQDITMAGGSSADLWGSTLTTAQVNGSLFGLSVVITNTGPATVSFSGVEMSLTIYYYIPFTPPTTTALTAAPAGAIDIASWLGAIWLLGGCDTAGGSAVHYANRIYYTNPITAGGGASSTDWQDSSSGLSNIIQLDGDSSDPGMGLAPTKAGLVILRRNSVWLLKGTTPANFAAIQITDESGCLDPRSIVETDTGVYFIGQKGLFVTDGTKVVNVSGQCMYTLQQAVSAQQWNVVTGSGGYITAGAASQGQILISLGARTSAGVLIPIWSGMYDPAIKAWTRITSALWAADGVQTAPNYYPGLISSDRVTALRSLHVIGSKYVTMLEDQSLAYSFMNQSSLYDSDTTGASHTIPLLWSTKYVPIIGTTTLTRKWGTVKRYFIDHTFAVGAGTLTPGSSPGWQVTPVDAGGNQYTPAESNILSCTMIGSSTGGSVSAGYGTVANTRIQRENKDFADEVDDLGFDVTYSDALTTNSASGVVANIYGLGIEYQPSRDR